MSDDAQPFDVSDARQVRSRRKDLQLRDREDREALGALLSTRAGRGWMYRHLEQCHAFASSFSANPYETAFREGERNIGLRLLADINQHFPQRYGEMIREANERSASTDARTASASESAYLNEQPGARARYVADNPTWTGDDDSA